MFHFALLVVISHNYEQFQCFVMAFVTISAKVNGCQGTIQEQMQQAISKISTDSV